MPAMDEQGERAVRFAEESGVRFVRLWFTDVLGFLKSFAIPVEELEKAFEEGIGFDGSAVEGFARVGVGAERYHHAAAPAQQEIDLAAAEALQMADSLMTLRLAVKEVAQELGLYATFTPKPASGIQGSGMHTHFKLVQDGSGANA